MLLSQEQIQEKSKQRQWIKRQIVWEHIISIINDLRLTNKEVLESTYEWIHHHVFMFKIKIINLYCTSGYCLSKSSLQLMLVSVFTLWISQNKITYSAQVRQNTQKNNFCIMNKIKLVWFYSLYTNYFLE